MVRGRPKNADPTRANGGAVRAKSGRPTCPERISNDPVALSMWDWLVEQLEQMGLLTLADRLALELVAMDYSIMVNAQETVAREGATMYGENGGAYLHPSVGVMNTASTRIRSLMSDLGLTPRAREQLNVQLAEVQKSGLHSFLDRNPAKRGAK